MDCEKGGKVVSRLESEYVTKVVVGKSDQTRLEPHMPTDRRPDPFTCIPGLTDIPQIRLAAVPKHVIRAEKVRVGEQFRTWRSKGIQHLEGFFWH